MRFLEVKSVLIWRRKKNYENKTTTRLKLLKSDFTNDQSEILKEYMRVYKRLYRSNKNRSPANDSPFAFLENIIPLKIDDNSSFRVKGKSHKWNAFKR